MKMWPHSSALQPTCSPHVYFSWLSGSGLRASPPAANDDVLISNIHNIADKFPGRIFKTSYIFQKLHVFIQGLPEGLEVAGLRGTQSGPFFLMGLVNREVTVRHAAWWEPLAGSGWWSWPERRLDRTATTSGQPGWLPDHRHSPRPVSPHSAPGRPDSQNCVLEQLVHVRSHLLKLCCDCCRFPREGWSRSTGRCGVLED